MESPEADEVVLALDEVCEALRQSKQLIGRALECADWLRDEHRRGRSHREALNGANPLIGTILRANIQALQEAGHRLRIAEVRTLHREGVTATDIAKLLGISRQRVGALMHADDASGTDAASGTNAANAVTEPTPRWPGAE